jgi:hypothetical protein
MTIATNEVKKFIILPPRKYKTVGILPLINVGGSIIHCPIVPGIEKLFN